MSRQKPFEVFKHCQSFLTPFCTIQNHVAHSACGCCSNGKELSNEQKQLRCQGLFDEFLQNVDVNEAVLCAQELSTPGKLPYVSTCCFVC